MPWTEVRISVLEACVTEAELALEQLGALAITLQDDADNPVLEPGPGKTPLWPSVNVCGLFEADVDRNFVTGSLRGVAGVERPDQVRWREVGDRDWERAWMDRFRPMKFGQRLWIVPSGMHIDHDPRNTEIQLDPGLAFGTGTHPTTALCLEWLDGQVLDSKYVVDYGCGSGILGIAAALKGASRVVCVDNDPQALEATADNAERNGVSDRIFPCLPQACSIGKADFVLANILAGPLIELAPVISACAVPGGLIVLSGLLEEQGAEVAKAYRHHCEVLHKQALDGWLRLDLKRTL